ncbi:MAG: 50S ribosomal protein L10 [bacterium]|nr:50S ribosomal protein L10 [bacterium]
MPLLRSQKKDLAKQYIDNFNKSVNVIVLTFDKLPVNELNQIRMDIADTQGVLQVVKKRILLKALDGSFEGLTLDEANATVMLLYVHNEEDEHAPLKVIQKYIKKRTKAKVDYTIDYV